MEGAEDVDEPSFDEFLNDVGPRLLQALIADKGPWDGADAYSLALEWAWLNRERLSTLRSPIAYLARVGKSRQRSRRRQPTLQPVGDMELPCPEPELHAALARLSAKQRTAVVLVVAFGWSAGEAAEFMRTSETTVRTHVARGMASLRDQLGLER